MCMMVFIATSQPLKLIPWEEKSVFSVTDLHEHYSAVRRQFDVPHVYFVKSYQGCGCGFQLGRFERDSEDRDLARKSLGSLATYITDQLQHGEKKLQLYACWAGRENAEPVMKRQGAPDILLSPDFSFQEKGEYIQFTLPAEAVAKTE